MAAEIRRLEVAGVDSFHFDVMDGHFVPNLGFSPDDLRALRPGTLIPFHVHSMVENPESFLDAMVDSGCDLYVFHMEATRYPRRMVDRVHSTGMQCGIAINPASPIDYLGDGHGAELVLVMAVEPGFAGQRWFTNTPRRIAEIRQRVAGGTTLGVDGHVGVETIPALRDAGASVFVCGTSALFGQPGGYAANVRRLRAALQVDTNSQSGQGALSAARRPDGAAGDA